MVARVRSDDEVGVFLRAVRTRAGLTQAEVARAAGMTSSSPVSEAERGYNVSVETLTRIARAMGYRSAVAMFQEPDLRAPTATDEQTERLLELWSLLRHPAARIDALETIALIVARSGARTATKP